MRRAGNWRARLCGAVAAAALCASGAAGCAPERGTVAGTVTAGGGPAPGAEVRFFLREGPKRSGEPFAVAETDSAGRFRALLPPGEYHVVARRTEVLAGRERAFKGEHPGNPVAVAAGRAVEGIDVEMVEMSSGGFAPRRDTAVTGAVTSGGKPAPGAYVFAYASDAGTVRGPSFVAFAVADERGRFRLPLREGNFAVVARRKGGEDETGAMRPDGESSAEPGVAVALSPGEVKDVGKIPLHPAREDQRRRRAAAGGLEAGEAEIRGTVTNEKGAPVAGVHVMAYTDGRMIGRPHAISGKTGADGAFVLRLPKGGRFFVGARSGAGGPVSPGEWVGTYDGAPDHSVEVQKGQRREGIAIRVEEKW